MERGGAAGAYERLPSEPEAPAVQANGGAQHSRDPPPAPSDASGVEGDAESPAALLDSETYEWEAFANLDQFFTRVYRYWEGKGFVIILASRLLNLLALLFTIAMSALLLLFVNWGQLQAACLRADTCDIWQVAVRKHPLEGGVTLWTGLCLVYLALFSAYWAFAAAHLVHEGRELTEACAFYGRRLGLSERQVRSVTWPEVAQRLVQVQRSTRLCVVRDLTEHDIVSRVMRKENYLVGMLNKGVLALNVPVPGLRRHVMLTKTLEWNLYWCVLDAMFDDQFRVKPAFLHNEAALRRRFRAMAACSLAAAPFLLVFLIIYFFMKNAERFYKHPSAIGSRRWSPLATWRMREFNELPHFIRHRLGASQQAAENYIRQFPNLLLSHAARLVAFVAGSIAALLLFVTLIDERLLERDLFGRQLVWWVAVVGVVVALSRALVIESGTAFDPELAMLEVVAHTHYLPRHWRGRAHTREVQEQFEALFQFKALVFLEELASILLTPLLLYKALPQCAGAILTFVEQNTVHVEGVGDICSLAAFDFQRHGNARYGAPADAPRGARSRQGKMEKSFLSFAAAYPSWEPHQGGRQLMAQVAAGAPPPAHAAAASLMLVPGAGMGGPGVGGGARQSMLLSAWQAQQAGGGGFQPGIGALGQVGGIRLAHLQAAAAAAGGGALYPQQPQQQQQQYSGQQQQYAGQGGWPPAHQGMGPLDASALFGSAELNGGDWGAAPAPQAAAQWAAASLAAAAAEGGSPASDRAAASQLLLQSFYEEGRRGQVLAVAVQQQQQGVAAPLERLQQERLRQRQQQPQMPTQMPRSPRLAGLSPWARPQHAQHAPQQQHPQQQQQQQAQHAQEQQQQRPPGLLHAQLQQARDPASPSQQLQSPGGGTPTPVQPARQASSGGGGGGGAPHSASPQSRVLGGFAASPSRQQWAGRSAPLRPRVSELSVLSRESSAAAEAAPPAGGGGSGGPAQHPPVEQQQQRASTEGGEDSGGSPPDLLM